MLDGAQDVALGRAVGAELRGIQLTGLAQVRMLPEPRLELPSRSRVVQARPGLEPVQALSLVRSAEYPRAELIGAGAAAAPSQK